jgi:hypothetical protein
MTRKTSKNLIRNVKVRSKLEQAMYANDFSILNPTIWANEAILRLTPNMIISNLIARDFDNKVAKFGDVVNAYIPGTFEMTRKVALCDDVVTQDASGSSIQVALNQWPQVSFLICDGEEDRSSFDLIENNLAPAVQALAEGIDRIVGSQVYQFLDNVAGHLGGIDDTTVKDYLLEARQVMNLKNAPLAGRVMLLSPSTETEALKLDSIMTADKIGDDGTALREAILGRRYGWTLAMTQTQPEISSGQTGFTDLVNNAAGYPVGATSIAFDGGTSITAGMWVTITGDDTPQHVTAVGGGTNNTPMTIAPGLKRAVVDNAPIKVITPGAVNNAAGYAIKYVGAIAVDGFANSPPQLGQALTFGTSTVVYTIIKVTTLNLGTGTFEIELDKPLGAAIADDAVVNLLPAGKYNFGLLRNAFTLVNRPLPAPRAGTGAASSVKVDPVNRISIRVVISYDAVKQAHRVTLDTLIGVGVLSRDLGVVMLG